jgi:hypothetical protein
MTLRPRGIHGIHSAMLDSPDSFTAPTSLKEAMQSPDWPEWNNLNFVVCHRSSSGKISLTGKVIVSQVIQMIVFKHKLM